MTRPVPGLHIIRVLIDIVGAAMLALCALVIGPFGVLRGTLIFERVAWYCWVLLPQGLLARSVRAAVDWRLGNFDAAIAQLEGLVSQSEEYGRERPRSRVRRRVLEDFYTTLARAYLHAGHIDDAMLVVIRAKKSLGLERLVGLAGLDAKTAHLVRAGLAAGRLLDGSGLATMFVKSSPASNPRGETGSNRAGRSPQRQGALAGSRDAPPQGLDSDAAAGEGRDVSRGGAKIIPFPLPFQTSKS